MPNMEELLNQISVEITRHHTKELNISKNDLDYAYGQMKLSKETVELFHCHSPDNCTAINVNFAKEMNQWRLKDRLPEERKYVINNHQIDSMIEAPFGVITAFPDDPNPLFNANAGTISSSNSTSSSRSTVNATTQTETEECKDTYDTNLTAALWKTEFAIAEFEQQNRSLNIELANLKNALCSANRSRAMAKENATRAEFKLEISERVTSDLFDENKELKNQIEEATSKAESLQSQLLEPNKTNILLNEKLDAFDVANKQFKEILDKKDTRLKDQANIDKLTKQLQIMRVEIDIQRAEDVIRCKTEPIPSVDNVNPTLIFL